MATVKEILSAAKTATPNPQRRGCFTLKPPVRLLELDAGSESQGLIVKADAVMKKNGDYRKEMVHIGEPRHWWRDAKDFTLAPQRARPRRNA